MPKSTIKSFRLNNLTGGINSIAEDDTLNSFDYKGTGIQAEATDIENFIPLNRGGQSKTTGFSVFKNTGSAHAITGLYRFITSGGGNYFLFSQTTLVYKLVSGTATSIGATVTSGAFIHFETAEDKCVICDGVLAPVFWDGSSITTISNGAPVGARQSLWYQNRLWIFPTASSLVYYSGVGDLTQGYNGSGSPNGGFVACDTNDGQSVVSISKFFIPGQLAPIILVQKTRGVGIIVGDGSSAAPYTFLKINLDIGGVGFRSAVQFGQDIAYLTPRGVTSYRVDNAIVNLIYDYYSEKVRNKFQALNYAVSGANIAWYDWLKTRISFAVCEGSNTTANVIWHYDTRLQCWYKERWNPGQDCTASMIDSDGTWYHGDSSGNIYVHDTSGGFNGQAINAYYTTGYMDFGDPSIFKHIRLARMMIRANGAYPLGISSRLNYGQRYGSSANLITQGGSSLWGSVTWGNFLWGSAPIKFSKFYPGGDWQNIQFTFTNANLNQPVDIFELEFLTEFTGLQ